MKRKRIYSYIITLIIALMSLLRIYDIDSISDLKYISFTTKTFEEAILNKFYDDTTSNVFNRVTVTKHGDEWIDSYSRDTGIIAEILKKVNAMEITSLYLDSPQRPNNDYEISFYSSKTLESISIEFYNEHVLVHTRTLEINEDKERKIITYDHESNWRVYLVKGNGLEKEYFELLLNTLEKYD